MFSLKKKTEEEIQTLRTVLTAKIKRSNELKRKLGITVWKEFRDEMESSIKNIQETTAYVLFLSFSFNFDHPRFNNYVILCKQNKISLQFRIYGQTINSSFVCDEIFILLLIIASLYF